MESPNNRGDRVPTRHFLPPNEISRPGNGLHLIELLAKGTHGNLQITQAIAKTIGCFPQSDGKTLLLKTVSTYLTEHGDVKLVPN